MTDVPTVRDPRSVPDDDPPPSLGRWLLDRLAEREQQADDIHNTYDCGSVGSDPATPFPCDCGEPARVLAEVAAKRLQIDQTFRYEAKIDGEWGCCHEAESIVRGECPGTPVDGIAMLRLLALPYVEHPDYREEWRPHE